MTTGFSRTRAHVTRLVRTSRRRVGLLSKGYSLICDGDDQDHTPVFECMEVRLTELVVHAICHQFFVSLRGYFCLAVSVTVLEAG